MLIKHHTHISVLFFIMIIYISEAYIKNNRKILIFNFPFKLDKIKKEARFFPSGATFFKPHHNSIHFIKVFLHFMSMKRMSMISKVCLGSGLGAGDNTFNTCVCVSTLVTTINPHTGLSTILSPSSALLTLRT